MRLLLALLLLLPASLAAQARTLPVGALTFGGARVVVDVRLVPGAEARVRVRAYQAARFAQSSHPATDIRTWADTVAGNFAVATLPGAGEMVEYGAHLGADSGTVALERKLRRTGSVYDATFTDRETSGMVYAHASRTQAEALVAMLLRAAELAERMASAGPGADSLPQTDTIPPSE